MRRREFVRKVGTVIIGAGIAPAALAEAARIPRFGVRRGTAAAIDDHIKDYLSTLRHFDEPPPDAARRDSDICRMR